jgi:hypothetical protein
MALQIIMGGRLTEEAAMSCPKSGRRLLLKGMEGEDVRDVQRKLNARYTNFPKLDENGKFGKETEKAVRLFQTWNLLAVDGKVGDCTWAALDTILMVASVTAEPGPQFSPLLNRMMEMAVVNAEHASNRKQGPTTLRMRPPPDVGQSPPLLDRMFDKAAKELWKRRVFDTMKPPSPGDRIYQFQGQTGGTAQLGGPSSGSLALVIAAISRTSQLDRHWEYGPFLQPQINSTDPRWQILTGFSVQYTDLWHVHRWHLASFYAQPSWAIPHPTLSLPIGHQLSFDLTKDGNLSLFVQDQAAVTIDLTSRQISVGAGIALGVTINIPAK